MDLRIVLLGCLLFSYVLRFTANKGDHEYKDNLFISPGLVWIEDMNGVMVLQHMYLNADLWSRKGLPKSVPIARTLRDRNRFTHMDVDIENKTMVLVDTQNQKIMALSFDSLGLSAYWDLYEGTSKKVNGIAVDWITDVVYWTDAAYDAILAVSMFSPNMAVVIVDTKLDEPYGIVTYPHKGYLFWTDISETDPRLMRSTLGGRRIKRLVRFSRFSRRAMSLFIDDSDERLYWVYVSDRTSLQGVSSCDIEGRSIKHLQIAVTNTYFDIGIFADQLLYIENGAVNIYQKDKSNRGPRSRSEGDPLTMVVIDKGRQYSRSNPCALSDCPGVCTMSGFTENCFCSELLVNKIDPEVIDKECGFPRTFKGLLLPKGDGIYTLNTNFVEYTFSSTLSKSEPKKILDSRLPVKAITSSVTSMKIFFYEYKTNVIKSLQTTNGSEPKVVSLAIGQVGGLAFDGVKHLYWTDSLYGHIMVVREDGMFPYVLHRHLEQPRAIAIHPKTGTLIWSETGPGKLMKSYLDGSSKSEIDMGEKYEITDIAVDAVQHTLYLCDKFSIYETDLEGTFFKIHYGKNRHIFTGLTIVHDYLVVADTTFMTGGLHVFDRKVLDIDGKMSKVADRMYPDFRYGNWYGVHYHHISNQPDRYDICKIKRAKCDQLCLAGHRRFKCVCSIGYKSRNSSCEIDHPYKPFLLIADKRYPVLLQMLAVTRQFVAMPVQGLQQPYSIAYDPVRNMIYWSDLETGTISRSFANGTNQEVIKHDPRAFFISLFVEPGSRLLFYVMRNKPEYDPYYEPIGSVAVMNIDTRKGMVLLDRVLDDPHGLAINTKHGYILLTEKKHIWRLNMNRTDVSILAAYVHSTTIATVDDQVYFANEVAGETFLEPTKTQLVRIGIDGENATLLLELSGSVSDLTVDMYSIYWFNETTRGVQRTSLENPDVIEDFGPKKALFNPTGLYVSPAEDNLDSVCEDSDCSGLCLPSPLIGICEEEKVAVEHVAVHNDSELCIIPDIQYGIIEGNIAGMVVPRGYKARVECFPAHMITGAGTITCMGGIWTDIPECRLEYDICGTPSKGYKVYKTSGYFFAYPEATKVDVICIGAGGGGYDVTDNETVTLGKAGDGGDSSFGSYLNAFGGKGGTATEGGDGGLGHVSGGSGSAGPNCITGGTACQALPNSDPTKPGYSYELFCGSGAYSDNCADNVVTSNDYAGPGGTDGNFSVAGYFGGGAGRRVGGSGGGGGGSRLMFTLPEKELVNVTVGQPGYPSYGQPAPGLVVVMWGDYRVDDYVSIYDVINECVLGDEDGQ